MPNLWRALRNGVSRYGVDEYLQLREAAFYSPMSFPLLNTDGRAIEEIENSFVGYTVSAYKQNGVVFATSLARLLLFTEARFQWQRMSGGRPGDLFGTPDLSILETPWPNGTTGQLLARMDQDVTLTGNYFAVREDDRIRRLRPDWVTIVLSRPPEEASAVDILGYQFHPGGINVAAEPETFTVEEICHWAPIPDPLALYRGMSWLTPVLREIQADRAATDHKLAFFNNGATLGAVVSPRETLTRTQFNDFRSALEEAHTGVSNAYKTAYVSAAVDVNTVGTTMQQLDFKATQGAGETRIAAAGGVPAIIVGLSEGMASATYSNYGMARRKFGDHWARPQWRSACGALASIVAAPAGARLWYDDRHIAFLREDRADVAKIQQAHASTIRTLIDAAFVPDSVVQAVMSEDWSLLKHSGIPTVQVQGAAPGQAPPIAARSADELEEWLQRADHNQLKDYWLHGDGADKWSTFTELHAHLMKYVGARADQIAAEWFHERYGYWPGSDKNRVAHGKPPRGDRVGKG